MAGSDAAAAAAAAAEAAAAEAPPAAGGGDDDASFTPALTSIDASRYPAQLEAKRRRVEALFAEFSPPPLEVFPSAPRHYRMRAEFKVWHEGGDAHFVMFEREPGAPRDAPQRRVRVDAFPVASVLVNELMAAVRAAISPDAGPAGGAEAARARALRHKLFQANFHSTTSGQALVTLIYHRKLDAEWEAAAAALRAALEALPAVAGPVHVVGRSRKQKVCVAADAVEEVLEVRGRALRYRQVEGAFSQPNAGVARRMLEWAVDVTAGTHAAPAEAAAAGGDAGQVAGAAAAAAAAAPATAPTVRPDLLELYCGNGNFTAAVAPNFRRVVATELSKSGAAAAAANLAANGAAGNVFVARMSSEDFTEAWRGGRRFQRLDGLAGGLAACSFGTLLVDPPRAGLDAGTLGLLPRFDRVVYVSCNPDTLRRDLAAVADRFEVKRFAMFDQFPYTHHVECGVLLERRPGVPAEGAEGGGGAAAEAEPPAAKRQKGEAGEAGGS